MQYSEIIIARDLPFSPVRQEQTISMDLKRITTVAASARDLVEVRAVAFSTVRESFGAIPATPVPPPASYYI
jgi:hypothetical protein